MLLLKVNNIIFHQLDNCQYLRDQQNFSVKPLPEDSLKKLHKSILSDFEKIIAKKLKEL